MLIAYHCYKCGSNFGLEHNECPTCGEKVELKTQSGRAICYKEGAVQPGAVAEEIEKLKNLIEELYMFHEDPSPNHRCSDEFLAFLKSQVEKRNIIENANKKNNFDAAEDDDLPF